MWGYHSTGASKPGTQGSVSHGRADMRRWGPGCTCWMGIGPHGAWPLVVHPGWVYTVTWSLLLWMPLSTSFPIFGIVGEVRTGVQRHACDTSGVGQVRGCSGVMVTCAGCTRWPKCVVCLGGPGYEAGVYEA